MKEIITIIGCAFLLFCSSLLYAQDADTSTVAGYNSAKCTYNYVTYSANNVAPGTAVTLVSRLSSDGTPTNWANTDWGCGAGTINNTNTITVYPTVTTTYCCYYNACWTYVVITVISTPDQPNMPEGDETICTQDTSLYTTNTTNNATSYNWTLLPAESGVVISNIDTTCSIVWDHTYSGQVKLVVEGVNGATTGPNSDTLFIDINYTNSDIVVESCESYIAPDGSEYITSGSVESIISNSQGCDSLIEIDLTIKNNTFNVITDIAASEYVLNGITYSNSGSYQQTLMNVAGCDSIITLNLTITNPVKGITRAGEMPESSNKYVNTSGQLFSFSKLKRSGQRYSLPRVELSSISFITTDSLKTISEVTDEGSTSVTDRGIVWSETTLPTIGSNLGITSHGSGLGTFTDTIPDLVDGTTYYIRSYATNSSGTSYSEQDTISTIPADGLVGYWPFNGNANDVTGNGNNRNVYGASLTQDRNGNSNSAYSFDGVNDYMEGGTNAILDLDNFTFSCWVNLNINTGNKSIGGSYSNPNGYHIRIIDGILNFRVHDGYLPAVASRTIYSTTVLQTGQWYNLVMTCDQNEILLFVNGIQEDNLLLESFDFINQSRLRIGCASWVLGEYFNGKIDDIRIYNRALLEAEIEILYSE